MIIIIEFKLSNWNLSLLFATTFAYNGHIGERIFRALQIITIEMDILLVKKNNFNAVANLFLREQASHKCEYVRWNSNFCFCFASLVNYDTRHHVNGCNSFIFEHRVWFSLLAAAVAGCPDETKRATHHRETKGETFRLWKVFNFIYIQWATTTRLEPKKKKKKKEKECRNRTNYRWTKNENKNLCNRARKRHTHTHSHTITVPSNGKQFLLFLHNFAVFLHFTIRFVSLQFVYFYFGCWLRSLVRTLLQTPATHTHHSGQSFGIGYRGSIAMHSACHQLCTHL